MSQPDAGAALEMPPDGTWGTNIVSPALEVFLERRGDLDLACAAAACDAAAAAGAVVDRKGDAYANGGHVGAYSISADFNSRHNGVNDAAYHMIVAVASGSVGKGDKAAPEKTEALNSKHVVGLYEIGGDTETGGDILTETKVPSPTIS